MKKLIEKYDKNLQDKKKSIEFVIENKVKEISHDIEDYYDDVREEIIKRLYAKYIRDTKFFVVNDAVDEMIMGEVNKIVGVRK